jgi:hypothetical protein
MYAKPTLLSVPEAARELWGEGTPTDCNRLRRMLHRGAFDDIAEQNKCPIIKDNNRFRIPFALIKAIRGEQ